MINLFEIWNEINSFLNKEMKKINEEYKFIKANSIHDLPNKPYCITNFLNISDNGYSLEGIKLKEVVGEKIKKTRLSEPQIDFSLTFYSDNQAEAFTFATQTMSLLQMQIQSISDKCDIILVDCTNLIDKTSFLEIDYMYKVGFDIKVRVIDEIMNLVNTIAIVKIKNENNKEEKEWRIL